jgi:hypothetical protein
MKFPLLLWVRYHLSRWEEVFKVVKTAIRPNYFKDFREISTLKNEKEKDDQDIHLDSLSNQAGWKILSEYIDNLKLELDKLVQLRMEEGATYEEIGQKSIIVSICKEYLTKIQNKVNDARAEVTGE